MKIPPANDFYDLPLTELRSRTERTCHLLREARRLLGDAAAESPVTRAPKVPVDRAAAGAVVGLLDAVNDALPGLLGPPRSVLLRTIADLTDRERGVLRQAIEVERVARERLAQLLGDVSVARVEDALARIDARQAVASEFSALLQLVARARRSHVLA